MRARVCVCVPAFRQFWTLVPVFELLARLEVDSPAVARRLVQLLFVSYMPVDKPLDVQLSRAIHLVRLNDAAARKFYLHAYLYLDIVTTGRKSLGI